MILTLDSFGYDGHGAAQPLNSEPHLKCSLDQVHHLLGAAGLPALGGDKGLTSQ